MSEKAIGTEDAWPVSWEAARKAQLRDAASSSPAQRLLWLADALRLASISGALSRSETLEKRTKRGLP